MMPINTLASVSTGAIAPPVPTVAGATGKESGTDARAGDFDRSRNFIRAVLVGFRGVTSACPARPFDIAF
jgi:hypothetical protein